MSDDSEDNYGDSNGDTGCFKLFLVCFCRYFYYYCFYYYVFFRNLTFNILFIYHYLL